MAQRPRRYYGLPFRAQVLRPPEPLLAAHAVQMQPFPKAPHIASLHQKEPGKTGIFLGEESPHSGLAHQIATVAIGKEALEIIVRKLSVHAPTEDWFKLIRAVRVQIGSGQAGTKSKT